MVGELSGGPSIDGDAIDFALAAFREEGVWQVQEVTPQSLESAHTLADALRRLPGDGGALGLLAMDEDFFIIVRVAGPQTRMLLSDITAADEFEFARSVLEFLGVPQVEDDEQVPAGDLNIVGDLGLPAMDMALLVENFDLYPDEMLADVAKHLGFGPQFNEAAGVASPTSP